MKEEYIQNITELLKKCNDPSLLDLIYQLLSKQVAQASQPHAFQIQG